MKRGVLLPLHHGMTNEMFDDSWKDTAKQIMQIYTMRTTGSYIDVKGSAVIWRFQDTDKDFGNMQAKELKDHLAAVLKRFAVQIITGKETVEVRPEGVDKGDFKDIKPELFMKAVGGIFHGIVFMGDQKKLEEKDIESLISNFIYPPK